MTTTPDFDRLMAALDEAGIAVIKTRPTDRNEGITPEVALWEAVQHWTRESNPQGRPPRLRSVPA